MSDGVDNARGLSGHFFFADTFWNELVTLLPDEDIPNHPTRDPALAGSREKDLLHWVDTREMPLAALCLSGGGIRSASFGLGALQALARAGVLNQFHYLSTVSGGGYIGSWLTAFRKHVDDDEVVTRALGQLEDAGEEAPEISGIRADSNYLTPKLGLLSADTWAVLVSYLRNLILNWAVFGPLFLAMLILPQLCARLLSELAAFPDSWAVRLRIAAGVALIMGLSAEQCARLRTSGQWITDGRYIRLVLLPLVVAGVCLTGIARLPEQSKQLLPSALEGAAIYGIGALLGILIARCLPGGRTERGVPGSASVSAMIGIAARVAAGAVVGMLISTGFDLVAEHLTAVSDADRDAIMVIAGSAWVVLSILVGELVHAGLASYSPRFDMDQEWLARSAGWMAAASISWALLAAVSLYGPVIFNKTALAITAILAGGVSGIVTLALGASAKTAATVVRQAWSQLTVTQFVSVAGLAFALFLAIVLARADGALCTVLWDYLTGAGLIVEGFPGTMSLSMGMLALLLAAMALVISIPVNVNRFSLHAVYRNRLIRAFLGSARVSNGRSPDPFTGFDPADNLRMAITIPANVQPTRLLHVVNLTLNVVSSRRLAWQERKAEAFSVTALACGNANVGYRATAEYGGPHGISLGTATAISGAAVSPNQGYNSSPIVGFLLMLFNVRLGWWLGNPTHATASRASGPWIGLLPALHELAGATTDDARWIYLSDGGHFENLGVYEMVRRHCRFIVVSDAGCDPSTRFEDLGNAVRKCFIDFGVRIEFDRLDLPARPAANLAGAYCAIGRIKYPDNPEDGWLLYVKPAYHGIERPDVRGYAMAHPEFPHETTTDQWFSESQFEAYRALGEHIFSVICRGGGMPDATTVVPNLKSLRRWAESYVQGFDPKSPEVAST